MTISMKQRIVQAALDAGFDDAGVAAVPEMGSAAERQAADGFARWVDAGRAGEMEYLKRRSEDGQLLRGSLRVAMPWARSVIVCVLNYGGSGPLSIEEAAEGAGWIARYAWSGEREADGELRPTDYHDVLLAKLRLVEGAVREQWGDSGVVTKCYVDTGPILERDYAQRAGVGWIGKNTCLLSESLGSWLLLGVIVTSLPVDAAGLRVAADRCGSCTRCIDACPTDALVAPREMDASRCIAYLTIEKKGAIPEEFRSAMGRQVFGCDICQDVCPWNRKGPIALQPAMEPRPELVNPALDWLAEMTPPQFRKNFRGSPLERTGVKRLRRNVAIAMGNSGAERFRGQLTEWRGGPDEVLAETAGWALSQIERDRR